MDRLNIWTEYILDASKRHGQRSGQFLFNHLPEGPAGVVDGTAFDPYYKDMSFHELRTWIADHLMFDGNEIICVFNGDQILWQAPPAESTNKEN
jgi:hypothetical protein